MQLVQGLISVQAASSWTAEGLYLGDTSSNLDLNPSNVLGFLVVVFDQAVMQVLTSVSIIAEPDSTRFFSLLSQQRVTWKRLDSANLPQTTKILLVRHLHQQQLFPRRCLMKIVMTRD